MNQEIFENQIRCNYCHKTSDMELSMTDGETTATIEPSDIDNLLMLINYCFNIRNNFFIISFNKNLLKNVYTVYNNIKTNILDPDNKELFKNIDISCLTTVRYICNNFHNKYFDINNTDPVICNAISKDSIKRVASFMGVFIRNEKQRS